MAAVFHDVGPVGRFALGRGKAVKAGGRTVAVFRLEAGWFAIQDACPHMGASLADGSVSGCRVTCFWHDWNFDLRTGQGDMRQWAVARVYPVEIREGNVFVGVADDDPGGGGGKPRDEDEVGEEWIRWDEEKFFRKKKDGSD